MNTIIRGTTPTIQYTFSEVDVHDIAVAYLTLGSLERDLSTATVGDNFLAWTLSQSETLAITESAVFACLNWRLGDGTRGASATTKILIAPNPKNEVI